MPADTKAIFQQIDHLIQQYLAVRAKSKYDDLSDLPDSVAAEAISRMLAGVRRLAPAGSPYREGSDSLMKQFDVTNGHALQPLMGLLKAIRADYEGGFLASVEELIHADLFADFLEMAEYLLAQGYKDPAAVVTGSVLEEHLRKLGAKNGISVMSGTKYKKADLLNSELAGANVYNKLEQKNVTAWLDLRNKAAHGQYAEYSKEQVQLMLDGIRHFMSTHAA